MSYQLKKLKINSFVGIEKADIDFGKPVSLFVGLNNQGKTTIRDAIRFAFTGKARGIEKFKDITELAHKEKTKELAIELQYLQDGEKCVIQRGVKNASSGVEGHNQLIQFCLEPVSFLDLAPRSRGAVLSKVLGGGLDELVEEAIAEHIGDINNKLLAEIRAAGIDLHDVNALKDAIVDLRRRYKREADVSVHEPELSEYELADDFDIAAAEISLSKLDNRIAKGSKIIKQAVELQQHQVGMADIKKEITELQKQIKPVPEIKGISSNKMNDLLESTSILKRLIKNNKDKDKSVLCPLCTIGSLSIEQWQEILAAQQTTFDKFAKALSEKQKIESANNQASMAIQNAQARAEKLQLLIEKYAGTELPKNAEKHLKELNEQRGQIAGEINKYRMYRGDCEAHKEKIENAKTAADLVDECNRIDEALKDGGPVKSAIAAGGRTLPINKKLLDVWGFSDFEWKDNGDILLNRRAIEQASKSEQYRAAALMGLALAEVGDVGFAALDEYEVLDYSNANVFFDAIKESGINNVLVFVTTAKSFDKIPDWMEVFKVDGGAIVKL